MNPSPTTAAPATTFDELMALQGEAFVQNAFRLLLGRDADPSGMGYYLGRLRAGYAKLGLLDQLARSNEGRGFAAQLPGLNRALQRHRRGQTKLWGPLFRWIEGIEGNSPAERQRRAVEQAIVQMREEAQSQRAALNAALADIRGLLAQGAMQAGPVAYRHSAAPVGAAAAAAALSPRAKPFFDALQAAIDRKSEAH